MNINVKEIPNIKKLSEREYLKNAVLFYKATLLQPNNYVNVEIVIFCESDSTLALIFHNMLNIFINHFIFTIFSQIA